MPNFKYKIELTLPNNPSDKWKEWLKEEIWRLVSDITRDKIVIKKINAKRIKS